jgi:uncharacterized protein YndB with AHSA1/START domain
MVANRGFDVGFHGEYRELVENERIVCTEVYEGMPEATALNTITFTEVDGRTTLSLLVEHARREHRDAHINSGMEGGMQEAMDLLEQVAISLLQHPDRPRPRDGRRGQAYCFAGGASALHMS